MDLDAYLARIGYTGSRQPSLATLTAIQRAHATSIVFENLDIHLGRPIRIDLPSIEAKLVADRRGGYCFEQNTLLEAALERLGFEVRPLAARVVIGDPALVRPRTHKLLAVTVGEERWLVDAGFGGATPLAPVRLEDGGSATAGVWTWQVARSGAAWVLKLGEMDLYTFTEEEQHPIDFEMANHFTSTHPSSGFVQTITVQWPGDDVQVVLRGRELTEFRPSGEKVTPIPEDALLEVLNERFGLVFPAGTRFSSPV